jgi:hypothetical protein
MVGERRFEWTFKRRFKRKLMLDTVQVKHFFSTPVSEEYLRGIGAKEVRGRKNRTFVLNPEKNEPLPRITFVFTPDGVMHLQGECSIPKLLFGHNARLPNRSEAWEGVQCMCDYVEARTGLPFDADTATASVVHYAKDIQIGESAVLPTIRRLSQHRLTRYVPVLYNNSTLYFNSLGKQRASQIRIYSKFVEVRAKKRPLPEESEAAEGNLRIEYCLLRSRKIDAVVKALQLPDKTAKTLLNGDVSETLISTLLDDLGFDDCLTPTRSNLERLLDTEPRTKAYQHNSFLEAIEIFGENYYLDPRHGISKCTYDRYVRECTKAKVWTRHNVLD